MMTPERRKEAIDMGIHGRFLVELQPDFGSDLFVEDRDVLGLFDGGGGLGRRGSLVKQRVLDPDDIEFFFTSTGDFVEEKRWLRKAVVRHVSEWSDSVDWVMALAQGEDWDTKVKEFRRVMKRSGIFRDALEKTLPFVWLERGVAQAIGLDTESWDGVLYHFHPIHFLMWLTYHSAQRIQVLSSGKSLREIKKELDRLSKQREKEGRPVDACELAGLDLQDVEYGTATEVLEEWFDEHDQGEWEIPRDEG